VARNVLFLLSFMVTAETAVTASAQQSSEELLWLCNGTGAKDQIDKITQRLICVSYISGAFDMLRLLSDGMNLKAVCAPARGVSIDQLSRVVVKWIERNPERMHESARTAVMSAVAAAFPCNKGPS
jgi:hypothetical protein